MKGDGSRPSGPALYFPGGPRTGAVRGRSTSQPLATGRDLWKNVVGRSAPEGSAA
jgi:hypothetical protein